MPAAKFFTRLFDEKLAQFNEELMMLNQANPTHPEFIAMIKVIDRRHDEKIEYEQTLLKYKLQALQTKSIAEKAQIHAQYMQTAREVRENNLENLHKESFQLQRERRNADVDLSDYAFNYPKRRSQHIMNQTAYNTEVSVLSGIAKHVGFPAAPELSTLRSSEIEEDLQSMGVSLLRPLHACNLNRTKIKLPTDHGTSSINCPSSSFSAGTE